MRKKLKRHDEFRAIKRFIRNVSALNHTPKLIRYVAGSRKNMMFCKAITATELQGESREINRLYGLFRETAGNQCLSFDGLRKKLLPVAECFAVDSEADTLSCCKMLGIPPDSTKSRIRKAYIKKARQTHPDTGSENHARFVDIYRAYRTLSEGSVRKDFESNLNQAGSRWIESDRPDLQRVTALFSLVSTNFILLLCLIGFLVCCALLADWFFTQNVLVGDSISFLNKILLCKA